MNGPITIDREPWPTRDSAIVDGVEGPLAGGAGGAGVGVRGGVPGVRDAGALDAVGGRVGPVEVAERTARVGARRGAVAVERVLDRAGRGGQQGGEGERHPGWWGVAHGAISAQSPGPLPGGDYVTARGAGIGVCGRR